MAPLAGQGTTEMLMARLQKSDLGIEGMERAAEKHNMDSKCVVKVIMSQKSDLVLIWKVN